MKAMYYEAFEATPEIRTVPDPTPGEDGVVIAVGATGLCRSDWHGWMGHDPDIKLPHVPGHELAGKVVATGRGVVRFKVGDRVTVPFVSGCGHCAECHSGNQQVCPSQFQPGFTHWGSFAEYVAIDYADTNLVHLPETVDDATAASLGCRFATSFRAVADQAKTRPGEWIAVHGCGGVGLSAIMIASALGANAIAIDISDEKLAFARECGAVAAINATEVADVAEAVREITKGGVHVSIDALGHPTTCFNSIKNLRAAAGMCRSASCSVTMRRRRSRWRRSSAMSWKYTAATACKPGATMPCSTCSPPARSRRRSSSAAGSAWRKPFRR